MSPSTELQGAQAKTLARLESISRAFQATPGSGRFAKKVGIVTGVGSEKGIGSVRHSAGMVGQYEADSECGGG